ncbi:unnamed protein product [Closterium sp. NIES-54]
MLPSASSTLPPSIWICVSRTSIVATLRDLSLSRTRTKPDETPLTRECCLPPPPPSESESVAPASSPPHGTAPPWQLDTTLPLASALPLSATKAS